MHDRDALPLLPAVAVPFIGGVGWLALKHEAKPAKAPVLALVPEPQPSRAAGRVRVGNPSLRLVA